MIDVCKYHLAHEAGRRQRNLVLILGSLGQISDKITPYNNFRYGRVSQTTQMSCHIFHIFLIPGFTVHLRGLLAIGIRQW